MIGIASLAGRMMARNPRLGKNLITLYRGEDARFLGDPSKSEIIKRHFLPLDDDHHMPPEGKPQLTDIELALIYQWIENGADTSRSIANLEETDTLFSTANVVMNQMNLANHKAKYEFDFADQDVIKGLNNPNRSVNQITPASPAISANIYVRARYQKEFLTELLEISEQIISLNMVNLPIEDDELSVIGQFVNLEKLILNGTNITGKTLSDLKACTKLKSLALSSTKVTASINNDLAEFKSLEEIFIWNTEIDKAGFKSLAEQFPQLEIFLGYSSADEPPLKLDIPSIGDSNKKGRVRGVNEEINFESNLPGTNIHFTIDGSEPDSTSPIYKEPILFNAGMVIKTIACKESWLCSDVKPYSFITQGIQVDTAYILTRPSESYHKITKDFDATRLIDQAVCEEGNLTHDKGFAYIGEPLIMIADMGAKPKQIEQVVVSYFINTGSVVFPPKKITVYGGNNKNNLTVIANFSPTPLTKEVSYSSSLATV
ncbi:MAG: chitobiase/beta-hexosaminidase C-terminal domain-containing protein, partial [Saccharospirillaceae bacterium]|nr:chitobiase/beta-hexosaminidase C-terminal domain-containing protein [Saccharospirillaceae bacterium]